MATEIESLCGIIYLDNHKVIESNLKARIQNITLISTQAAQLGSGYGGAEVLQMFLMRAINSLFSNDINCSMQSTKDMPSEKEDSKFSVRDQISFCNLKMRTIVI